jgi:hypothetical protein
MNFSGTTFYPEVTNCTGYIAYIDRVIMHKKIAKDGNEAAVEHFKIYKGLRSTTRNLNQ